MIARVFAHLSFCTFFLFASCSAYEEPSALSDARPSATSHEASWENYWVQARRRDLVLAKRVTQLNESADLTDAISTLVCVPKQLVTPIKGGPEQGLSGNSLFKVDREGDTSLIVKVFTEGTGEFTEELWALSHFASLQLQELHVPRVHLLGRYKGKLLLVQDFAPGNLLNHEMQKLLHLDANSSARLKQLTHLKQAYEQLGRALGELHTQGNPRIGPLHPMLEDRYRRLVDAYEHPAQELFYTLLDRRQDQVYSYTHGDVHGGNYLYDSQQLWIIDVTDSASSIGIDGAPMGNAMIDLSHLLTTFRFWKQWGLKENEHQVLHEAVLKGYAALFPEHAPIDGEEFHLFQIVNAFGFLHWIAEKRKDFPESALSILEMMEAEYLKLLDERVDPLAAF